MSELVKYFEPGKTYLIEISFDSVTEENAGMVLSLALDKPLKSGQKVIPNVSGHRLYVQNLTIEEITENLKKTVVSKVIELLSSEDVGAEDITEKLKSLL